jgi:hypothetical protein
MRTSAREAVVAGLLVMAIVFGVPRADAQPVTPAGQQDPSFLGVPEFYSQSFDLSFYEKSRQEFAESAAQRAKQAINSCSRQDYDKARKDLENEIGEMTRSAAGFATAAARGSVWGRVDPFVRKFLHDIAQMQKALEKFPPFPEDCKDKRTGALMDVFIQGGAALAFQSSGFFRALDTLQ